MKMSRGRECDGKCEVIQEAMEEIGVLLCGLCKKIKSNYETGWAVTENHTHIEREDETITHYLGKLRKVRTRGGEVLSDSLLRKFRFTFQEDGIRLDAPLMKVPLFASTARFIERRLEGRFVGGRGAHFILPYPK